MSNMTSTDPIMKSYKRPSSDLCLHAMDNSCPNITIGLILQACDDDAEDDVDNHYDGANDDDPW